jgi:hypothetical protein
MAMAEKQEQPKPQNVEDVQRKIQKGIRIVAADITYKDGRAVLANGNTKIFDSEGRDITTELRVRKITITVESACVVVATLECLPAEIDVTVLEDRATAAVAYPKLVRPRLNTRLDEYEQTQKHDLEKLGPGPCPTGHSGERGEPGIGKISD